MKKNCLKNSGFSLVETLVAITILLVIIVGPMTLSTTAAQKTSFSSEQVEAFFLAQEGVEIAQKGRDDLLLKNFPSGTLTAWNDFTNVNGYFRDCFNSAGCGLELNTDQTGSIKTPAACSTLTNCNLHIDTNGGRSRLTYTATGNEKTAYTRVIKMVETSADKEVRVTSTVTWRTGSLRKEQKVEVVTYLYKIY